MRRLVKVCSRIRHYDLDLDSDASRRSGGTATALAPHDGPASSGVLLLTLASHGSHPIYSFSPLVMWCMAMPHPWTYNHCHRGSHYDKVDCDGGDCKASRGWIARHCPSHDVVQKSMMSCHTGRVPWKGMAQECTSAVGDVVVVATVVVVWDVVVATMSLVNVVHRSRQPH